MTAPIKKRVIEMIDDDISSTPTFASPVEDGDEVKPIEESEIVGKTLQVPILESHESLVGSPLGLADQAEGPTKKRKLSLSPQDSLARNPTRRKSPRKSNVSDEDMPIRSLDVSTTPFEPGLSRVSMVTDIQSTSNKPYSGKEMNTADRSSLKTNLFPKSSTDEETLTTTADSSTGKSKTKATKPKKGSKTEPEANNAVAETPQANEKVELNAKDEQSMKIKKGSKKKAKLTTKDPSTDDTVIDQNSSTSVQKNESIMKDSSHSNKESSIDSLSNAAEEKPKKKKKKRSFQDQVLELLFMTGQPYSVKMLVQQLQTTDSSVEFCLLSLVDKGWVFKKEFASKSRAKELYWANQEAKSKELMDSLNMVPPHEIEQAQEELGQLQRQQTLLANELAGISKTPSNLDLNTQLLAMEKEVQDFEQRLQETHERIRATKKDVGKSANTLGINRKGPCKPKSSQQLKKRINHMRIHWKNRKEKCMDFIEQLADGMEKKVKEVVNLLELETDEIVGVKIPPKHDDV